MGSSYRYRSWCNTGMFWYLVTTKPKPWDQIETNWDQKFCIIIIIIIYLSMPIMPILLCGSEIWTLTKTQVASIPCTCGINVASLTSNGTTSSTTAKSHALSGILTADRHFGSYVPRSTYIALSSSSSDIAAASAAVCMVLYRYWRTLTNFTCGHLDYFKRRLKTKLYAVDQYLVVLLT